MRIGSCFALLTLVAAACAPAINSFEVGGDEETCTVTLRCESSSSQCDNAVYDFVCSLDPATDGEYDCVCRKDGVEGETFSESGVCERGAGADNPFANLNLADVSAHGVDDCQFPLATQP